MKKIATITFHNAINVGAVLQAYALQKTLENLGFESKILNYRNDHIERSYKPLHLQHKSVAWFIKTLMVAPIRISRNRKFHLFIHDYIKVSKRLKSDKDFEALNDIYDVFFVGSDQVWNPYHTGRVDGRYFLDFVTNSKKKKSYAASFGLSELPDEFKAQYKSYITSFSSIAVRERSAVAIIKDLDITTKPKVVLDPVYLIDVNHWKEIAIDPPKKYSKYLLVFCVNGLSNDTLHASRLLATEKGLDILYLARRPQLINGVKVVTNFAPREFLGYIKNAEYIVTDSFHAMSFSIIFKKDFKIKIASQHGHKNNRSLELMETLKINNRLINGVSNEINWDIVSKQLNIKKSMSIKYLIESVNGSEQ